MEDVLIARKTLSEKETIELQFAHLFSQLTIHLEDEIQENLKEIQLITPVKIEKVSPEEGTFSILNNALYFNPNHYFQTLSWTSGDGIWSRNSWNNRNEASANCLLFLSGNDKEV